MQRNYIILLIVAILIGSLLGVWAVTQGSPSHKASELLASVLDTDLPSANEMLPIPTILLTPHTEVTKLWSDNLDEWVDRGAQPCDPAPLASRYALACPGGKTPLLVLVDARSCNADQLKLLASSYSSWTASHKNLSDAVVSVIVSSVDASILETLPKAWRIGSALSEADCARTQNIEQLLQGKASDVIWMLGENWPIRMETAMHRYARAHGIPLFEESELPCYPPYSAQSVDEGLKVHVKNAATPKNLMGLCVSDGRPDLVTMPKELAAQVMWRYLPDTLSLRLVDEQGKVETWKSKDVPWRNKTISHQALYATSLMAGNKSWMLRTVAQMKRLGLDTFVINIKDIEGIVGTRFDDPLSIEIKGQRGYIGSFKEMVDMLHAENIRVCARVACFRDHQLAGEKPQWSLRGPGDTFTGWMDPTVPEVRAYMIRLGVAAAKAGADAVQFDYIRYPERGTVAWKREPSPPEKARNIDQFMREAYIALTPYKVSIEGDVFGVMLWQTTVDLGITGQHLRHMSRYLDAISPMIYPSHFGNGFRNVASPANEPYAMIAMSCVLMDEELGDLGVTFVPWLQGFGYKVSNYGPWYLQEQIRALRDHKIDSYLIWNAGNVYETSYQALEQMAAKKTAAIAPKAD